MSWGVGLILAAMWLGPLSLIVWDVRDKNVDEAHRYERTLATWTIVLASSTCLLFAATAYSAYVLNVTDETLKDTLVASNRAWLAPRTIALLSPLKEGEAPNLLLFYGNIGKEPAIKVHHHAESRTLLINDPVPMGVEFTPELFTAYLSGRISQLDVGDSCAKAQHATSIGVIYPGPIDGYSVGVTNEKKPLTKEIVDGAGVVVVKGCFIYETMRRPHKGEYCFLYSSKMAVSKPSSAKNWFSLCPAGNDAT